jgi:hypothetical protein
MLLLVVVMGFFFRMSLVSARFDGVGYALFIAYDINKK